MRWYGLLIVVVSWNCHLQWKLSIMSFYTLLSSCSSPDEKMAFILYDIPANNSMSGNCSKSLSSVWVSWENQTGTLGLVFRLNDTTTKYQMDVALNIVIAEDRFPGAGEI